MGGSQGNRVTQGLVEGDRDLFTTVSAAPESHLLTPVYSEATEKSGLEPPRSQRGYWGTGDSAQIPLLGSREVSSKQMSPDLQEPEVGAQGVHLWGARSTHSAPPIFRESSQVSP